MDNVLSVSPLSAPMITHQPPPHPQPVWPLRHEMGHLPPAPPRPCCCGLLHPLPDSLESVAAAARWCGSGLRVDGPVPAAAAAAAAGSRGPNRFPPVAKEARQANRYQGRLRCARHLLREELWVGVGAAPATSVEDEMKTSGEASVGR